ncbi:MAG: nucleotidyltransferase family protein [Alphaproteobacteria bacterium]|nr:nucleotidyltransferase family protein [Alphaproteobacteria bacterium]
MTVVSYSCEAQRIDDLFGIVRLNPVLMQILHILQRLDLPDWRVVSGAIYQTVWNSLTQRPYDYGIKDYDIAYYNKQDMSYEAEDHVIRQVISSLPISISQHIEVRNQARVHLWYESKFGSPYPALANTDESLLRYLSPAHAVAIRMEKDGSLTVAAPFGLSDLFSLIVRANPHCVTNQHFAKKAEALKSRWPEITIL